MRKINVKEIRKQERNLNIINFVKFWGIVLIALVIVSIIENL